MKKIYVCIATAGCLMSLLNYSAAFIPEEMLKRLSPSSTGQSTWKADPQADYAVSLFKDGLPPYVSIQTGAFWTKDDAEFAETIAQKIANQTGKSIHNHRPVRAIIRTPEGAKAITSDTYKVRVIKRAKDATVKFNEGVNELTPEMETLVDKWKKVKKGGKAATELYNSLVKLGVPVEENEIIVDETYDKPVWRVVHPQTTDSEGEKGLPSASSSSFE